MPIVNIPAAGQIGVVKDLSQHELPINAWTAVSNIRFLDGMAGSTYGYASCYGTPSVVPYNVSQVRVSGNPYWIYAGATAIHGVSSTGGTPTHTDLSGASYTGGGINTWTSTVIGGLPVLTNGTDLPLAWDLNIANNFATLSNWPASTYCKSLRTYKNYLVALNVTKTSTNFPYLVKWSHPADPGALPASWDHTDATKDAGETDISTGIDAIVDGLTLGEHFLIYKERSCHRMTFTGGSFIFSFKKVNDSGLMAKNCVIEVNGMHLCLTKSDVVLQDGQSAAVSVLDKMTRRYLFQNIDMDYSDKCFVFSNPFVNEAYICYPSLGSTACDKAMVYNWIDKTVSFRDMPTIYHAANGFIDLAGTDTWASDSGSWDSDTTLWGSQAYTPDSVRVLMACAGPSLFALDSSSYANGTVITSYLERQGMSFGQPEGMKLIKRIRPRITGTTGTVKVSVGSGADPYVSPAYGPSVDFTVGSTIACDVLHSGRYISVKFESGTAAAWRLDSYDIELEVSSAW